MISWLTLGYLWLQVGNSSLVPEDSIQQLKKELIDCQQENERLTRLLNERDINKPQVSTRPLPFRIQPKSWTCGQEVRSGFLVIQDRDSLQLMHQVQQVLVRQKLAFTGLDTIEIPYFQFSGLRQVYFRCRFTTQRLDAQQIGLLAMFQLPDGTWVMPDNYPGYYQRIYKYLEEMIHELR